MSTNVEITFVLTVVFGLLEDHVLFVCFEKLPLDVASILKARHPLQEETLHSNGHEQARSYKSTMPAFHHSALVARLFHLLGRECIYHLA